MSTPLLKTARCILLSLLLGTTGNALAQNTGFQLNRYEPTAAGEWSLAVDHPWYSRTRYFAAGVTLNYAHNPLVFGRPSGDTGFTRTESAIEHQFIGHLDLAGSFLDRVLLTASLPITFLERGNSIAGVTPADSVSVGDPRFGFLVRLFGQPYESPLSLSLGASVWVPLRKFTNSLPAQESDQEVRVLPKLVLGGLAHSVLWSATVGVLIRPSAALGDPILLPGRSVGSEFQLGVAIGYANRALRLAVGPEVVFATTLNGVGTVFDTSSLEILLGLHYNIAKLIQFSVGGGVGVLGQPGTPDGRALLRLAYAPVRTEKAPPQDRDHDGIIDAEDACPSDAGPRRSEPQTNGCPDRDADQIVDHLDRCPEVPRGEHPDPDMPGCPLRDSDHDGIFEPQDTCPSEPQGEHPDPALPGCPLRDLDGDGVLDPQDKCPSEPQGAMPDPALPGCPLRDRDRDGVLDPADQCPDVAQGAVPDPAKPGCPAGDRDRDSVQDPLDACPDQPGAPNPDPKKHGCPGLVEVQGGKIVIVKPVFFATNKEIILTKSHPVLESVANALKASPQIKKVRIEGHTDDRGKAAYNVDLSDRRAKNVMKWLVEHGVGQERLEAQGFGPQKPIADNKTAKGRVKNRRVDFVIVDPAQSQSVQTLKATEVEAPDSPDQSDGSSKPHRRHRSKAGSVTPGAPAAPGPGTDAPPAEAAPGKHRHHRSKAAGAAPAPSAPNSAPAPSAPAPSSAPASGAPAPDAAPTTDSAPGKPSRHHRSKSAAAAPDAAAAAAPAKHHHSRHKTE